MEDYLSLSLPMVNETNMKNFVGKYVIVHGKVNSVKNNSLFLSINPELNTDIIVKNFSQNPMIGSNIKIVGKVYHDLSLDFLASNPLKEDFDLKMLNELIPIQHHPEISSMFFNLN